MANSLELKDKPLTGKELKEEFATTNFNGIQRARPRTRKTITNGSQVRIYTDIAENPVVKQGLETLISGAFWSEAEVSTNNDYEIHPEFEQTDQLLIDIINFSLDNLDYETFDNVLKNIVWNGLVYGFSVSEIVWDSVNGQWNIDSIKTKPSFEFDFNVNETDDLESVQHLTTNQALNPKIFALGFYPYVTEANYYGVSLLESIRFDVRQLEELEKVFVKGSANVLNKTVAHYQDVLGKDKDAVANEKTTVETALNEGGGVIHFPVSTDDKGGMQKMNLLETIEERASEHALEHVANQIIEIQKRIKRAFGVADNLGQSTVPVGSHAKAKTEFNMFLARVQEVQAWISNVVNRQIIPSIIFYNFGELPDKYLIPTWKYKEIDEDFEATKANTAITLKAAGIITTNESRNMIGLTEIDENEIEPVEEQESETTSLKRKGFFRRRK